MSYSYCTLEILIVIVYNVLQIFAYTGYDRYASETKPQLPIDTCYIYSQNNKIKHREISEYQWTIEIKLNFVKYLQWFRFLRINN